MGSYIVDSHKSSTGSADALLTRVPRTLLPKPPSDTVSLDSAGQDHDADAEEIIPTDNLHGDELARAAPVTKRQRPTRPKAQQPRLTLS